MPRDYAPVCTRLRPSQADGQDEENEVYRRADRFKAFESENAKLKRLMADAMLDQATLKDLLAEKRFHARCEAQAVAHFQDRHGMSKRRGWRVIDADHKSMRYRSTRDDDAGLREQPRELAKRPSVRLSPAAHPTAPGA